jgi:hypothetical protein
MGFSSMTRTSLASWTARAGWACWSSIATLTWIPAAVPASARTRTPRSGIPMIGVAKSRFRTATHAVPVVRGSSVRLLFVTRAGMPGAEAADLVRRMAGRYRLPDALRRADTLAQTDPSALGTTDHPVNRADARLAAEARILRAGLLCINFQASRLHVEPTAGLAGAPTSRRFL